MLILWPTSSKSSAKTRRGFMVSFLIIARCSRNSTIGMYPHIVIGVFSWKSSQCKILTSCHPTFNLTMDVVHSTLKCITLRNTAWLPGNQTGLILVRANGKINMLGTSLKPFPVARKRSKYNKKLSHDVEHIGPDDNTHVRYMDDNLNCLVSHITLKHGMIHLKACHLVVVDKFSGSFVPCGFFFDFWCKFLCFFKTDNWPFAQTKFPLYLIEVATIRWYLIQFINRMGVKPLNKIETFVVGLYTIESFWLTYIALLPTHYRRCFAVTVVFVSTSQIDVFLFTFR